MLEYLIDIVQEKLGLEHYRLHNYSLYRQSNIFLDTKYVLSMEWFPTEIIDWEDEDLNPHGTAVIEIDVHNQQLQRIIFVGGKSMATHLQFDSGNIEGLITWIEQETGLRYIEQFQLKDKEDNRLHFQSCYNGTRTSPSGYINIELDDEGILHSYSIYGEFPYKDLIKEDTFALDISSMNDLFFQQVNLLEFPSDQDEQWVPAYVLEEIYVKNDGSGTIEYDTFIHEKPRIKVSHILTWEEPLNIPFKQKRISLSEDVSIDEALSAEPHPDTYPISEQDIEKSVVAVRTLLRSQFSKDSGKWMLVSLFRENGYLHAILKQSKSDRKIFSPKIHVFIDPISFKVVNYIENKPFLEMCDRYKSAGEVTVSQEAAVELLHPHLELTPLYVYDFEKQKYVLCGKLDCQMAVVGTNGRIVKLDDL
ncbi:hypothetical protein [Peribacillus alkalitolerans]|uniref:hypothetical protein n=1 Tax=Peribacillus alkalitolerans TaxID=1550385 RepID=UPI0013D2A5EB|nr:hypothetical protein [Peribacillus alkalitolerans]